MTSLKEKLNEVIDFTDYEYFVGKYIYVSVGYSISKAAKYADKWGNSRSGVILFDELPASEQEKYLTEFPGEIETGILIRFKGDDCHAFDELSLPSDKSIDYDFSDSEIKNLYIDYLIDNE